MLVETILNPSHLTYVSYVCAEEPHSVVRCTHRKPAPSLGQGASEVSLMARKINSELVILICSVGKKKVSLYCNSQLGPFLNAQMLLQCSAYIFDFLPLIFV